MLMNKIMWYLARTWQSEWPWSWSLSQMASGGCSGCVHFVEISNAHAIIESRCLPFLKSPSSKSESPVPECGYSSWNFTYTTTTLMTLTCSCNIARSLRWRCLRLRQTANMNANMPTATVIEMATAITMIVEPPDVLNQNIQLWLFEFLLFERNKTFCSIILQDWILLIDYVGPAFFLSVSVHFPAATDACPASHSVKSD
jgi:hypothetical protein